MQTHRPVFAHRHNIDASTAVVPEQALRSPEQEATPETLFDRVARAKAKWLKRVMYETSASSTQKCFAYAVFDHLNCVTLDSWPSQERLVVLLGVESTKTVQRAALGLERLGVLVISGGGRSGYRYQPVFLPNDEDKVVRPSRHSGSADPDNNVRESLLVIHPKSSAPTSTVAAKGLAEGLRPGSYMRRQRGAIELQLAERLGPNGMDILARLGAIDDRIVERLCRAFSAGQLGQRELLAASLAFEQARQRWM